MICAGEHELLISKIVEESGFWLFDSIILDLKKTAEYLSQGSW
jgi:hypothetical protein